MALSLYCTVGSGLPVRAILRGRSRKEPRYGDATTEGTRGRTGPEETKDVTKGAPRPGLPRSLARGPVGDNLSNHDEREEGGIVNEMCQGGEGATSACSVNRPGLDSMSFGLDSEELDSLVSYFTPS